MVMILHHTSRFNQASRFGSPRSCQICLNPVWWVGCEGTRIACPNGRRLSAIAKLVTAVHGAKNWIQTNLATKQEIESCTRLKSVVDSRKFGVDSTPDLLLEKTLGIKPLRR